MVKTLLKSPYRYLAARLGPHRWRRGPCLLVLTYHRVLPHDHPDRHFEQPGMVVSPDCLAMHLETLQRHFELIHLNEWVRRLREGTLSAGRYAALTFDDGWADNFTHAWPVLKEMEAPFTIFLVTDLVGTRDRFWPNRLGSILSGMRRVPPGGIAASSRRILGELGVDENGLLQGLNRDEIDKVIESAKRLPDAQLRALCDQLEGPSASSNATRDLLTWDEVLEMKNSGLGSVGSHTRRHTRLTAGVAQDALEDEICGSAEVLSQRVGASRLAFCYPNGNETPEARALVATRYEAAVTTQTGWNSSSTDPLRLRRVGIHEDVASTPRDFQARIAAWRGL